MLLASRRDRHDQLTSGDKLGDPRQGPGSRVSARDGPDPVGGAFAAMVTTLETGARRTVALCDELVASS